MSFNNDDLFKAISDAAEMSLDAVAKAMNCLINSSSHIQEQINILADVQQHSINSTLEKAVPLLNNALNQAACASEDALNSAISKILSMDISTFNNQVQHLYDNMPENIENNIDDDTAKIAEVVYNSVKEFNANPNTAEKVKIPFCETPTAKNLKYALSILVAIVQILFYSGYNIKEDFVEPVINTVENPKTTDITNE